jgi:hypothetical protein
VKKDPVKRLQELVATLRSSSQRREEFRRFVAEAIRDGRLTGKQKELLRDMPVRWSSTFKMLERYFEMSEVRIHDLI